jgi:hypothetical protein
MATANTVQDQEILINRTQQLIDQCLESGAYSEAIALGELIKNLSESYRSIVGEVSPSVGNQQQPVIQIQRKSPAAAAAFGGAAFNNRTIPQQPVRQQPPKPTSYQWADGFEGVTLPPNPEQAGEAEDYWQDPRRQ